MESTLDRRDFATAVTLGLGAAAVALPVLAQRGGPPAPTGPKKVRIGVSTLAWNVSTATVDNFEAALKDISELGLLGIRSGEPDR